MYHSVPVLRVEEWPLPGDSLTADTVRALIDRVSHLYRCISQIKVSKKGFLVYMLRSRHPQWIQDK